LYIVCAFHEIRKLALLLHFPVASFSFALLYENPCQLKISKNSFSILLKNYPLFGGVKGKNFACRIL